MTTGLESRCTIVMSFEDTTVMLQSGVPVTSNVGERTYEYYRFSGKISCIPDLWIYRYADYVLFII